jgi:hypothetical protein
MIIFGGKLPKDMACPYCGGNDTCLIWGEPACSNCLIKFTIEFIEKVHENRRSNEANQENMPMEK